MIQWGIFARFREPWDPSQKGESKQTPDRKEASRLEAEVGIEPTNDGFANRCLSHLATPP